MNNFAKALALFGAGSSIGTLTQIVKGKLGAIFLGVEGVGVLNQLTNAWGLLYTFSGLGFYNGIVQRISQADSIDDEESIKRQFTTSLVFISVFSIVVTACSVVFSPFISNFIFSDNGEKTWLVIVALSSVPFAVIAQTYVGLFSGYRLVRQVVAAQVLADIAGLFVFIILVINAKLLGAVFAFSISHILKLIVQIYFANRQFAGNLRGPLKSYFQWVEVSRNLGYGASGLILVLAGIATTMLVSRWIIDLLGMHANGIFSTAWKVCSLYFGALYASASGYYFPSLSSARNNVELRNKINEAITLYLYILTPIAVGLIIGGGELMKILFSYEFVVAASLLLWFLPGDLFRIIAETIGLSFLAKRRLIIYTATYFIWAALFLLLSWICIRTYGLIGVGYAYLISHAINALVALIFARFTFGFTFSNQTIYSSCFGLLSAFMAALIVSADLLWWVQYGAGLFILLVWMFLSWRDAQFRELVEAFLSKVKRLIS